MFGYCAPPPENRNTTVGTVPARSLETTRRGSRRRSTSTASCVPPHTDRAALRECRDARLLQRERRRPPDRCRGGGATWSASRSVAASSADWLRAESSSSVRLVPVGDGSAAGASSTTTCALVPPTPRALTPARRGWPWTVQSFSAALTKNGVAAKSIAGLGLGS